MVCIRQAGLDDLLAMQRCNLMWCVAACPPPPCRRARMLMTCMLQPFVRVLLANTVFLLCPCQLAGELPAKGGAAIMSQALWVVGR